MLENVYVYQNPRFFFVLRSKFEFCAPVKKIAYTVVIFGFASTKPVHKTIPSARTFFESSKTLKRKVKESDYTTIL